MVKVPAEISESIFRSVQADLEPPLIGLYAKTGTAILAGGILSLFLCGQFGFGLSPIAHSTYAWIVGIVGSAGCHAFCGIFFAIFPVFVLRALSSPMLFRVILRKKWWMLYLWTIAFGLGLLAFNGRSDTITNVGIWSIAAMAAFALLAKVVDSINARFNRFDAEYS
ncbi:MAG: hypothetical protein AB7T49_20105 [Oligoflexales bacterium]